MGEGKQITTINFYLRNIIQFLRYLEDTPPKQCRLRRGQFRSILRMVLKQVTSLARPIVTHQLKVKARKLESIVSPAEPEELPGEGQAGHPGVAE